MSKSKSYQLLNEFILNFINGLKEKISSGSLKIREKSYYKLKVDGWSYDNFFDTENGSYELLVKKEGIDNKDFGIYLSSMKESAEYKEMFKTITNEFNHGNLENKLDSLFYKIKDLYLSKSFNSKKIKDILLIFFKDLMNEPLNIFFRVELSGLMLESKRISISDRIKLSQSTIEDIEKESQVITISEPPTSILDLKVLTNSKEYSNIAQKPVELLKLFKLCSLIILNANYNSEIWGGNIKFFRQGLSSERGVLLKEEELNLKKFWKKMETILPSSFYDVNSEIDFLTISYNRFNDALFHNGGIEKRISSSIMGLEAIFLKSNEKQELSYKLRIRMAKIFGLVGYDPIKIKGSINKAYSIRSEFVHGGHLDSKKLSKLERQLHELNILSKEEKITKFIRDLLNYLRISIVLMVILRDGNNTEVEKKKNDLINLIDDSLIDKEKEKKLSEILSPIQPYLIFGIKI